MPLLLLAIIILFFGPVLGQSNDVTENQSLPAISEKIKGMKKHSGYFNFYWDARAGNIWLEIDQWDTEFLYLNSLPAGIGSNDIGLDRGQLGARRIVKFQRVGPKVLMVEPNYSYRAITKNSLEAQSVEEAFAQSVLWGFKIEAETDGKVLVNAAGFFLRDAHDVTGTLKRTEQGSYKLDESRSAFYLLRTKNFPNNTEVEVTLTFTGNSPGQFVRSVVPTPEAITIRQHYSFIKLPDDGYEPRVLDPRCGFFGISYLDYAAPLGRPIQKSFIARHRLKKKDPSAQVSDPVEPIVYYLDNGTPEPVRSALLDGARWWNQAFREIGYQNAFQVKILPDTADPMDIRYNVIQWVHRSTRGWSYGDAVVDPRTGEIIKGHVSLGSLRVRQDFLIAEGLLSPYREGKTVSKEMQEMALARLRQLSAHEVGHTIGLMHNFAASAVDRASVMDYPHPLIKIDKNGKLDLSDAYTEGVGEWDKAAIAYGYQNFPESKSEKDRLTKTIENTIARGLIFISDQDARPLGGAHPLAHLWDNGKNAVDELARIMKIREIALRQFSANNIQPGMPMAKLEEVFVPIYFFHRYQIESAAKILGGYYYTYSLRGDNHKPNKIVDARRQRKALQMLLKTIEPKALAIPFSICNLIPPRAFGMSRNREVTSVRTGVTFDPLAAAEAAANLTVRAILHPDRAARLIEYHSRNKNYPGLAETINKLVKATWLQKYQDGFNGEIQRVINNVVLFHLIQLAKNEKASIQAQAMALLKITDLSQRLSIKASQPGKDEARASYIYAITQIKKFLTNPKEFNIPQPAEPPAGSPIGNGFFQGFRCGLD